MSHRASSCPSRTYGGDALDIVGWVTLDNQSGKTFENAAIKLMAGDVSKVQLQQPDHLQFMRDAGSREVGQPPVTEKAFDEFHLYTLVRPATLRNREIKQVEFLRGERVTAKTAYCLPLPAGRTRFYRRDDDGRLEFTGENTIDHTPQGKTLLIYTGDAFDVVGDGNGPTTNSTTARARWRRRSRFGSATGRSCRSRCGSPSGCIDG